MEAIAGAGFFTVEVLRPFGLVRNFVFFVIDIGSRRLHIAGISNQPSGPWMTQIARNLIDCFDGFLRATRYLILDRDPLYTRAFRSTLANAGVNVVQLPSRSPNLNAFADRFVLSMKSECLDRTIPLGERHLRHLHAEYVEHYHRERNHQGLGNKLIEPIPANTKGSATLWHEMHIHRQSLSTQVNPSTAQSRYESTKETRSLHIDKSVPSYEHRLEFEVQPIKLGCTHAASP